MSEENVATMRKAYDDFNSGNVQGVIDIIDENVDWTEPGGGNAPSGTFTSQEEVAQQVFGPIGDSFDEFVATPDNFEDEDNTVTVTGRFTGKNKSGADLDAKFTHRFELENGKITKFEHTVDEGWAAGWS
jgi:ketosteroid isomerase-like protein